MVLHTTLGSYGGPECVYEGSAIGGKAPKEIAISVSAELLGILYN